MPLTYTPFTMLVPTAPNVEVELNILLEKLSRNEPKSVAEEPEVSEGC